MELESLLNIIPLPNSLLSGLEEVERGRRDKKKKTWIFALWKVIRLEDQIGLN